MTDAERAFQEAIPCARSDIDEFRRRYRAGELVYCLADLRAIWNARGAWDAKAVEQTADDPVEQTRIIDAIRKGDV